jgi:HK97 family phage portal protein
LFGLEITRSTRQRAEQQKALQPIYGHGGWWSLIREPFAGAWQRNIEIRTDTVLANSAVFRCISLISSDIAKMRIRLVAKDNNGIWTETENPAFSPVLRKPNRYQSRIQFFANWIESKLIHGNTYVLKERDVRNVVTRLYVLDPNLVTVLVAPDGSVFYELRADHLTGITGESVTVPASEIIHDRWNTLHHPLVGMSPIRAAGLAALQGIRIQENSTKFFECGGRPSGILTAPGHINAETAQRLAEAWNTNYGSAGPGVGKTAVLGDGIEYKPMVMTSVEAQLIEQLKWSAETVCSVFGVPAYMAGVGDPPAYNNIEALSLQYYTQALQVHIEAIEVLLDEALGLGPGYGNPFGVEFDLTDLMRMDTKTKTEAARQAIQSGMSPNEIRKRYFDLGPVDGGETPYLQEQQWPLRHLAERPLPSQRPITEPEPIPSVPDEAEAKRFQAIRRATQEFRRLAAQERDAHAKLH